MWGWFWRWCKAWSAFLPSEGADFYRILNQSVYFFTCKFMEKQKQAFPFHTTECVVLYSGKLVLVLGLCCFFLMKFLKSCNHAFFFLMEILVKAFCMFTHHGFKSTSFLVNHKPALIWWQIAIRVKSSSFPRVGSSEAELPGGAGSIP